MKILVTRTDRLGDVMLATPVLKKLRLDYPSAKITFLVQKQWTDVLQYPDVEVMEYTPGSPSLVNQLKEKKFDIAVVLRDESEVSWAIRKASIPYRIGPYSSLRSFFIFNRGKWQRRSQCLMHESEYNLQLLEKLPVSLPLVPARNAEELPRSWIAYPALANQKIEEWLAKESLKKGQYICLHPGSSGSARYLKPEVLVGLVSTLQKKQIPVVLTGGAAEAVFLEQIATQAFAISGVSCKFFGGREGTKPLSELAELYRLSKGVVAHGTGPLHLAAAVDAAVYAIFPPIFVLSEKRWGPLTARRTTWVPTVECPAIYQCQGEKCPYFDCMDRFAIDEAVQKILHW